MFYFLYELSICGEKITNLKILNNKNHIFSAVYACVFRRPPFAHSTPGTQ